MSTGRKRLTNDIPTPVAVALYEAYGVPQK